MSFSSFSYPMLVFVSVTAILLIITLPIIHARRVPLLNKKFFWKAMDYTWLALAFMSLAIAYGAFRIREAELRITERAAAIDIKKAWALRYYQTMRSASAIEIPAQSEIGSLTCKWDEVRRDAEAEHKLEPCQWLHTSHEILLLTPFIMERGLERLPLFWIDELYRVGELHPLSSTETQQVTGTLISANQLKAEEELLEYLRARAQCNNMSDWRFMNYYTLYIANNCNLVLELIDQRVALSRLDAMLASPWIPSSSWPFILAIGLAIRVTRTTAEVFIDYRDQKSA
ncbi:MAG: hypothetical protein ACKVP3_23700 [Hyphomicrobiaceae bacterium]